MLTPELQHYTIYQEQLQDRLRDIQRRQLLQAAELNRKVRPKLYRQTVGWLGMQMVRWGSTLQNLGAGSPANHVTVNR